jgi:hypothetical protein
VDGGAVAETLKQRIARLKDRAEESDWVFAVLLVAAAIGYLYLRNGPDSFTGKSGGQYWDNRQYCETHPKGRMKVTSDVVSCRNILRLQEFCSFHQDDSFTLAGETIDCDRFLAPQHDHSPWDGRP